MYKASLVSSYHLNNKIFDIKDIEVNRDNGAYWFYRLKCELGILGVDLSTYDINKPDEADVIIFFDVNKARFNAINNEAINILFIMEPPSVNKLNFDFEIQNKFDYIFTWDDSVVDNIRFFKFSYANYFPDDSPVKSFVNREFSCLIAGNKYSSHKYELYSERRKIIEYFVRNMPSQLDLYGPGWNNVCFSNSYLNRFLNKMGFSMPTSKYDSVYKGICESKFDTLSNYKFSFCLENQGNINGYITEKIFDCFFSNTIPIYMGADNVHDIIPEECYIDYSRFTSFDSLISHLESIDEPMFDEYLHNKRKFLNSKGAEPFKADFFGKTIAKKIYELIERD